MKKLNHLCKNQKGTALVATLMFLAAMGVLSTALVFTVQNDMKTSTSYKYGQQAFYQANAAVQDALQWFSDTKNYTPHTPASDYTLTTRPVRYHGHSVVLAGKSGSYSIFPSSDITTKFSARFSGKILAANDRNTGGYSMNATLLRYRPAQFINPDFTTYTGAIERWRLESTGTWGPAGRALGVSQITAIIENNGEAMFDRALWGKDLVDLKGADTIDSYDPRYGVYDPVNNHGNNGAIGTNGLLEMVGGALVKGDAAYGPNGRFSGDPDQVTGNIVPLLTERTFAPVPSFTAGSTIVRCGANDIDSKNAGMTIHYDSTNPENNKYGRVTVQGDLHFEPGTYYIGTLDSNSGGTIHVSGPTTLYVEKNLNLTGHGVMNSGTDPSQLTIFFAGTGDVKMTGSTTAYVELYAPEADLRFSGGANFSGSFIGKTATLSGGSQIHFSNGCLNKHLKPRPFRLITWSQDSY